MNSNPFGRSVPSDLSEVSRLLHEALQQSDIKHAIEIDMVKKRLRNNPILKDMHRAMKGE